MCTTTTDLSSEQYWALLRARTHDGAFAGAIALQVAEQVAEARAVIAAAGGELLASSGLLFAAQGQTQAAAEMQWLGGLSLLGALLLKAVEFLHAIAI